MIKKRLVALLTHAKKYIVLQVFFQWLGLLVRVALSFVTVDLLSSLVTGQSFSLFGISIGFATEICVIVAGLILGYLLDRLAVYMSYRSGVDVKKILRKQIYEKLLRLGTSYGESVSTSSVVQLAVEGVDQLEIYFGKYLSQLFYSLLAPLTLFVILSFVDFKAALVLLICVPLIPMSIVFVQKIAKRLLSKYWGEYTKLGDGFLDHLEGLTTLKIYEADEMAQEKMDRESEHFRKITMKVLTMQLNSTSVMDIMAYGGAAVGMLVALAEYRAGAVNFGGALLVLLLSAEFFLPLRLLGSYFHIAMNGMAASDRMFELLDLPERQEKNEGLNISEEQEINEGLNASEEQENVEGPGNTSMELSHVSFSYEDGREILSDISLQIPQRGIVSLVGGSGCGKSTIAALLSGQRFSYEGEIKIGGCNLRKISRDELLQKITLIKNDDLLFKGTVRENLLLAKEDATDGEMEEALKMARVWEFLIEEQGLNTYISEGGKNLSGGQRQRIALARGILRDSPIYILDEATGNIDRENEDAIMESLRKLSEEKTILLISHRLKNVVQTTKIHYMENGRISESGTHEELMNLGKGYASLYKTQQELESLGTVTKEEYEQISVSAGKEGNVAYNTDVLEVNGKQIYTEKPEDQIRRRSSLSIMSRMIGLVTPLLPVMALAILLGILGFLCAIFLTVTAAGWLTGLEIGTISVLSGAGSLLLLALFRGLLHYGEQYCNHFIAFKLLALIRHKVFAKLRTLSPAKLEGKDKGNLIAVLTSDIELLEVFYAHTISPICIAFVTCVITVGFFMHRYVPAGILAIFAYLTIGLILPVRNGRRNKNQGFSYRNSMGTLNSYVLESLRGLRETMQFGAGEKRLLAMEEQGEALSEIQGSLSKMEGRQRAATNLLIQMFSFAMLFLTGVASYMGKCSLCDMVLCTVLMMGSFGPVVALSNLSTTLSQTLASGERVLNLLEEEPQVREVTDGEDVSFCGVKLSDVSFSYEGNENSDILSHINLELAPGEIIGIFGKSGCGKSTILKLLMRFWDVTEGELLISGQKIGKINTYCLRETESYVTQETYLFKESIFYNIALAKKDATKEEVEEAAKKASLHEMILSLTDGYDTKVAELGESLSAGERQRIGLARAFLHGGEFMLLDEPTSNLDAVNEGEILKALVEEQRIHKDRTVVLVSHRKAPLQICHRVISME